MNETDSSANNNDEALGLRQIKAVYVYDAPVRFWHLTNGVSIVILIITGYFIGTPLPSSHQGSTEIYSMGWIRLTHFVAAYIFAIGFLGRLYWVFAGNAHAKQIFYLPIHKLRWWGEVIFELKWYMFMVKQPKKYIAHNPLARVMMFTFAVWGSIYMILTGFALYSEGEGSGHWSDICFGWILDLSGGSMATHSLHRIGMWVTLIFATIHTYAAIREDIVSRQSILATMSSGWRTFRD